MHEDNTGEESTSCPTTTANRLRTKDVQTEEEIDFSQLLLSPPILEGLKEAGYLRPSPIQLKAIPLGRFGVGKFTVVTFHQHQFMIYNYSHPFSQT